MNAYDRRNFLRVALGVAAVASLGLPATSEAQATALPMLKPVVPEAETGLVQDAAVVIRYGRRRRRRRRGWGPRRVVRRCFVNRRGRRVCVIRRVW